MDFILDPPRMVGPVEIGMPFAEAESMLRLLEGYQQPMAGVHVNAGYADFESGLSISVGRGRDGNVEAVEVYRPTRDITVICRGIAVFEVPADEVVRRLSELTPVQVEDEGLRVLAPDLVLSLWRSVLPEGPDDEDGRYFEAALVAGPGYYGLPVELGSADDLAEKRTDGPRNEGQSSLF